jgi:hypothetical protein
VGHENAVAGGPFRMSERRFLESIRTLEKGAGVPATANLISVSQSDQVVALGYSLHPDAEVRSLTRTNQSRPRQRRRR